MITRKSLFFCIGLCALLSCETQSSLKAPEENYFLKYYGNQGSQQGVDFIVNTDGSFVLLGNSSFTNSLTDQQIYVAKADSKGLLIWEKYFGGKYNEEAIDIELLSDGSLLILANSEVSPGSNKDVLLLKLSQDGLKLDSVRQGLFTGSSPNDENAKSISITLDGYVVAGSTSQIPQPTQDKSDFMYMRFRTNFTFIKDTDPEAWNSKPISGFAGEDVAVKVIQFNATTYYVMGYSNVDQSNSALVGLDFNFYLFGLGKDGVPSLGPLFIGSPSLDEKLTSVSLSPAQSGLGYLLSGTSQSASEGDVLLVKLNDQLSFKSSDVTFLKTIDLPPGKSLLQKAFNSSSPTNGYFITSEQLTGSNTDIVLTKRDNSGNEIFKQTFGGVGNDLAGSVLELPDGQIAMIGTMTLGGVVDGQRKIVFMKLNPAGLLAP